MSYQQEHFTAIADKIRERTNTTDLIIPNDFPSKIDDVYWAGHADGNNAGYSMGWEDGEEYGYTMGFDAGYVEGERMGYYFGKTDGYNSGYSALENELLGGEW